MSAQNRGASPESAAPDEPFLIYRIDKFVVPDAARDEFMERVRGIHAFLRTLPGFVQDSLLEQTGGPGEFNIVTIAVWDGAESVENAREAAAARYKETGFNPRKRLRGWVSGPTLPPIGRSAPDVPPMNERYPEVRDPAQPPATADQILKTYVTLTLFSTFASSFIWGINTLFLLDAGLSITEAFAANAFFTVGQVLFEVPTGVAADTLGRRISYLLGSATLLVSTGLYLLLWQVEGAFWAWAIVSILLGLGFTFFSGATEAWLVDGLTFTKYSGTLEAAFAKGQIAGGVAMLTGTLAGGAIAQVTNLGVPYVLRVVALALTFAVAFVAMHDVGFVPQRRASVPKEMRRILMASLDYGFRNPPVRWLMLAAPFSAGVGFYAFYAMQPYLLELYGRSSSYAIAGLAAAIVAGAQIVGGYLVPYLRTLFRRRTSVLLVGNVLGAAALALIGLVSNFWVALGILVVWAVVFAATTPVRQAFVNGVIPSEHRATVLSSDNLLASSGGVVFQPALGRVADAWGYGTSYVVGAAVDLLALPFILLARRERAPSDPIQVPKAVPEPVVTQPWPRHRFRC